MFGIAAIVVMLCSFDMEYDELLANLRRAGMWLPAVVGLWIIIYLFNTLSWYIIIRDGKKGTPIPFWKVYKLTVSGFALNYATPVGLMGGEPYRIMELTPYVGASKATSSVILYVMMHIFSHFCFWFFFYLFVSGSTSGRYCHGNYIGCCGGGFSFSHLFFYERLQEWYGCPYFKIASAYSFCQRMG